MNPNFTPSNSMTGANTNAATGTPTSAHPTHKHLALWIIVFVALIAGALVFWKWNSAHPVGGSVIEQYNTTLQNTTPTNTDVDTTLQNQAALVNQALENDINSSLNLDVEDELKSIDLEF
jgi:hypothetical protein